MYERRGREVQKKKKKKMVGGGGGGGRGEGRKKTNNFYSFDFVLSLIRFLFTDTNIF